MNFGDTFQQRVTIIGAGTMGASITELFVVHGWEVNVYDKSSAQLDACFERITASYGRARARLLNPVTDLTGINKGGFVIESVPEDIDLKISVLAEAEDRLSPSLLTTNTSSLSIEEMQSTLESPERFLGLHFFQPVATSQLIEVIHSSITSAESLEMAIQCAEFMQRRPIVVRDSAGFATSRLAVSLGLEAMRMVEEGIAAPEDIDAGMRLGYGHEVGPLRMTDIVGLDVRLAISNHLATKFGARFEPPRILRRMVAEGKLGRKSGQGFFRWENSDETS